MPKRTRRKSSPASAGRTPKIRKPGYLHYKVVELSSVDEGSLERTVNSWVRQGWNLEGVQFAMRESSKRPSMAFVFFTREGAEDQIEHDVGRGGEKLRRIAGVLRASELAAGTDKSSPSGDSGQAALAGGRTWNPTPERAVDPWVRLAELAADPEESR